MVDNRQNGELLGRISGIRKKFAQETDIFLQSFIFETQ